MEIEVINDRKRTQLTNMKVLDVFESTAKAGDFYMVVSNGRLVSLTDGEVTLFVTYYGRVGNLGYLKESKLVILSDSDIVPWADDKDEDEDGEWEIIEDVDSSFIERMAYNKTDMELTIVMHGQEYIYCEVPETLWFNFKEAWSQGEFYNSRIKGQYDLV